MELQKCTFINRNYYQNKISTCFILELFHFLDNFQIWAYLEFIQVFFIFCFFLNYICIIHLFNVLFIFTILSRSNLPAIQIWPTLALLYFQLSCLPLIRQKFLDPKYIYFHITFLIFLFHVFPCCFLLYLSYFLQYFVYYFVINSFGHRFIYLLYFLFQLLIFIF